jgi:peptidoglycan/LPS O-acetylase OafA/YrhL
MSSSHHNNFDLLRLTLALLVVLGHFKILPSAAIATGIFGYADSAVDAFFIISGYLVYASFDKNPSVGSFYIRRLLRIYPLYVVVVLIQGLVMAMLAGGITANANELLHYLAVNLVFANFLAPDLSDLLSPLHVQGINPSLWTLKVEVAFYIMLPLLWYFIRHSKLWGLVLLYSASTAFAFIALYYDAPHIARQLPGELRYFIVGVALYRYRESLVLPAKYSVIAALLLLGICSMQPAPFFVPFYPLYLGLLIFICAMRLPAVRLPFDISYGVYLFHGPLIQFALLMQWFENTTGFLVLLLCVTCGLAWIAERVIERPGIKLGHHLSLRWAKESRLFTNKAHE